MHGVVCVVSVAAVHHVLSLATSAVTSSPTCWTALRLG